MIGACVFMAFVWFLKGRFFPDSLESQARRFLDCASDGNAGCVQDFMLSKEKSAYAMTGDKLKGVLDRYVNPAFASAAGMPTVESEPLRDQGEFLYTLRWQGNKPGDTLQRSVTLALTPDGARAPNAIQQLVLDTFYAKYRRSSDENLYLTYVRGVDHDAAALSGLGLTGLYDETSGTVKPWAEVRATWIQKLKARGFNGPAPGDKG